MIATFLIVGLALIWLGIESDWLRVNLAQLETGACCQWHLPDGAVDHDMRMELIHSWPMDKLQKARFIDGLESPLCGWGYAWQYRNVSPEIRIEVNAWNVRTVCNLKTTDAKLLRELSAAMLKPNKEERRELVAQRKLAAKAA